MQGRGIEEQFGAWALVTRIGNVQWAALPVEAILELFVVFSALEQRQHLIVRPAGITKRGPVVVVPLVSSHIEHRIDGARSTESLATWLIAATAIQAGLRHRLVAIVIDFGRHHRDDPRRRMNKNALVSPAGFQQTDGDAGAFCQPRRHYAPGAASTNP